MHVSLTARLEKFDRNKVDSGLYNNASEVVREALRLMQESESIRRLKLGRLKRELAKGEADLAAGRFVTLADDEELEAFFAKL
jgi:antitoxin ParD1/3/4